MTTIAAVVPLHNKRPHIERALTSILRQSVPVDECIVIDDASTDDGMTVVEAFKEKHPDFPIVCLKRETPGPGGYAARNLGIEQARSEWIGFLDADDEWSPNFVESVLRAASEHGSSYGAIFGSRLISGIRDEPFLESSDGQARSVRQLDFDQFLGLWKQLRRCPVWTSATAMRRDDLIAAGLFPACRCKRGGDKDTWIRVIEKTNALALPEVVATYHNDVVNQVTRLVPQNQAHCMIQTLDEMAARHKGETRNRLEWLINHEITMYAARSIGRARLASGVFTGFRVAKSPLIYVALRVASALPMWAQTGLASGRSILAALRGRTG